MLVKECVASELDDGGAVGRCLVWVRSWGLRRRRRRFTSDELLYSIWFMQRSSSIYFVFFLLLHTHTRPTSSSSSSISAPSHHPGWWTLETLLLVLGSSSDADSSVLHPRRPYERVRENSIWSVSTNINPSVCDPCCCYPTVQYYLFKKTPLRYEVHGSLWSMLLQPQMSFHIC